MCVCIQYRLYITIYMNTQVTLILYTFPLNIWPLIYALSSLRELSLKIHLFTINWFTINKYVFGLKTNQNWMNWEFFDLKTNWLCSMAENSMKVGCFFPPISNLRNVSIQSLHQVTIRGICIFSCAVTAAQWKSHKNHFPLPRSVASRQRKFERKVN